MKYEIERGKDGTRVAVEGELDLHVANELREVLAKALADKPGQLIVDLAQAPFIDSSGIATLVEAAKRLRQWSGVIRVENAAEAVRDTFEIAGLTKILGVT
jgi:anti-sigma B factor antagonist